MQHCQGISRQQLQINSLEDKITLDNPDFIGANCLVYPEQG
jgi:hypothetical protein